MFPPRPDCCGEAKCEELCEKMFVCYYISSTAGSKPILHQILVLESQYRTMNDTWMGLGSLNREAAIPYRLPGLVDGIEIHNVAAGCHWIFVLLIFFCPLVMLAAYYLLDTCLRR